jgi:hypothetical protein
MPEHFRLLYVEHAPPDKWLALGKYCLQQSGVAPEVTELIKAQSSLWHRQVQPATPVRVDVPDPFPHPQVETLWQALLAWGLAWPATLHRWLTWGTQHGDSVHWRPGWQGLQRRLQWVHGVALSWLGGGPSYPWRTPASRTQRQEGRLLALPKELYGVFPLAAQLGRGKIPVRRYREPSAPAANHAQLTLTPPLTRLEHTVVRAAQEAETRPTLQARPLPAIQAQGQTAALQRLEDVTPQWQTEWTRTARTELAEAYNHGAVQAVVEEGAETVVRIPSVRACLSCRRLYLEADGAPKILLLSELLANGTNEGRKEPEWRRVRTYTPLVRL